LGFPSTKTCRLTNTSLVPVTFKLRVSEDGTQPAVSSLHQIRSHSDPSWRKGIHFSVKPREFTMNPSQGTILPQGHQDIEVTLCSNTVMEFYRKMLVDLEGLGEGVASLTITARYQHFPGLPQHTALHRVCWLQLTRSKRKEDSPVFYSSPKPCGIVEPQSTAEIPVVVEIQTLGKHCTSVS
ncbi:HYDIN protein, partial [Pomatorhinus ruficollis]|nr:HYDIN protein [Pomatorhinus ruficollis]